MSIVSIRYTDHARLTRDIAKAVRKLGKDVVRVRYSFGEDWSGDPCVNFRIVLTDAAAKEERLWPATSRIERIVLDDIAFLENWGLIPYFNYRSKSEDAALKDPKWA